MGLEIKNLFQFPHVIKIPELVMTFLCLILHRTGDSGNPLVFFIPTYIVELQAQLCGDVYIFGHLVIYGFFLFNILLIIGVIMDEKSPIVNILFAQLGFVFYLAVGSKLLSSDWNGEVINSMELLDSSLPSIEKGFGSLCILTGVLFLIDAIVTIIKCKKS